MVVVGERVGRRRSGWRIGGAERALEVAGRGLGRGAHRPGGQVIKRGRRPRTRWTIA